MRAIYYRTYFHAGDSVPFTRRIPCTSSKETLNQLLFCLQAELRNRRRTVPKGSLGEQGAQESCCLVQLHCAGV